MNRHPSSLKPTNGAPTPPPSPKAAPRVVYALVPLDVLQGVVDYLKKRPYDEVALALAMIASECKNEDGTPLQVGRQPEAPHA